MGKWLLRALVLALCMIVPAIALADADPGSPEDQKRRGDDAMVALRYADALSLYEQAYKTTKNAALLYNMGRAYEGLGDFPKALDNLEQFNRDASADLKARVPKLAELIADVSAHVAGVRVTCTVAGADIRLGTRIIGTTIVGSKGFRVPSGPATLEISAEGYFPFKRDLTLAAGKTETVDALLASRTEKGVIKIQSPTAGASVTVDGTNWGVVPAEAFVLPGQHRVILQRDGYDTAETNVVLAAGERKDVSVPMVTRETLTQKWWFWTGVGVVVAGGIVAGVLALTQERGADTGTIPPGQVKASFIRF